MSSLRLGLSPRGSAVQLRAAAGHAAALKRLATTLPTAVWKDGSTLEVDVDDLLGNLRELARWPEPESVEWDPTLRTLVEDVVRDAQTVEARLRAGTDDLVSGDDVDALLSPDWAAPLTSFQRRDVTKLLSLRHGANFSVPGAGKTRVALAVYDSLKKAGQTRRMLVVCPKSAFESWLSENAVCFPGSPLRTHVYTGTVDPTAEVLLVNYERLPDAQNALTAWLAARPSLLVLDEAHRMKLGPSGVYGSVCLLLGPHARRRLILTGTPAPNGAADLANLMAFVWPGHGRDAVTRAIGGGDLRHASNVLRPLFVRTTKKELDLPPTTVRARPVDLPPLHREIYAALCGQLSRRAEAARGDFETVNGIVAYLLMAAISPALLAVGTTRYEPLAFRVPPLDIPPDAPLNDLLRDLPSYELSPKFGHAVGIVAENARKDRKTLVWSTFVRSLTTLERLLAPYQPAVVHGGVLDREAQLGRFRQDPDCMVLLSNPATLGEGISLHDVCHDAVYVDRDFSAGRYLQSVDRIHRLGLRPDVDTNVTVLVARDTIDDVVEQRLETKLRFMGAILDDPSVRELGDLEEETASGAGFDTRDLHALLTHLHDVPAT